MPENTKKAPKVVNKSDYGKAFGKALFVISVSLLLSGITGLFGDKDITALISVAVLIVGLIIGIVCIIAVQKKYNNGIF